jgi:predicted small lipoprotein YifL
MMLLLLTTLVATCGQKGPLYLPDEGGQPGEGSAWTQAALSLLP